MSSCNSLHEPGQATDNPEAAIQSKGKPWSLPSPGWSQQHVSISPRCFPHKPKVPVKLTHALVHYMMDIISDVLLDFFFCKPVLHKYKKKTQQVSKGSEFRQNASPPIELELIAS